MALTGLTQIQIATIQSRAGSIQDYRSFLASFDQKYNNATILGLNKFEIVTSFTTVVGCRDYGDLYEELYQEFKEKDDFLEKLTEIGNPIIFLVPGNLMNHKKSGATKREMEWLLANPQKMENVHFIFGAYESVSKKTFSSIPYKGTDSTDKRFITEYQEKLTTELFSQIRQLNSRSSSKTMSQDLVLEHQLNELTNELRKFNLFESSNESILVEEIEDNLSEYEYKAGLDTESYQPVSVVEEID